MTIVQTSDTIIFVESRLHGQAVKTPPFHGGNRGSNPLGVTKIIENKTGDSNPRSTSLGVTKIIENKTGDSNPRSTSLGVIKIIENKTGGFEPQVDIPWSH